MSQSCQGSVTICRDENAATLQQYANNKRIADQFNDVIVVAGTESIPANRLVLSCYSKFFESVFLSPMKERHQNEIEIQKFDGRAVRALIDFMYSGKIKINETNVVNLLSVADCFQMKNVKQFCFEFLEDNLSISNCFKLINLSIQENCPFLLESTYKFISRNFDQITQTGTFKHLSKSCLVSLISDLDSSVVKQSSVYNAILSWTQADESRKKDFTELFLLIKLPSLSIQILDEVVSNEPLVKGSNECLNALTAGILEKFRFDCSKVFKIVCVNGYGEPSVFEVYRSTGVINKFYPSVPNKPRNHCLLTIDNCVYCIGGCCTKRKNSTTNKVYLLNLSVPLLQWREVASMSENREYFGAAVYNGCLVANGSNARTKTTEVYDPDCNNWRNIAATNRQRGYHQLVATDEALFAIGGHDEGSSISSVERLDDLNGQWREVQPMNTPRHLFAAVACRGFVYAIGGYSTKREKTVEKYNPKNNSWAYVSSMNVERYRHAACVFQDKIYVIGGRNAAIQLIKTIECYDPEFDQWTIVKETARECLKHAVVAVQEYDFQL